VKNVQLGHNNEEELKGLMFFQFQFEKFTVNAEADY